MDDNKDKKKKHQPAITSSVDFWSRFSTTYKVIDDYIDEITRHNRYKSMGGNCYYGNSMIDDRSRLIDLYDMALEQDAHVRATIETLESQILGDRYSLGTYDSKGDYKIDLDETEKIQGTTFDEAIRGIMEAKLYGFTVLEILPTVDDISHKLNHIKIVERRNVLPSQGKIIQRASDPSSLQWDILSKEYRDRYVLVKTSDLGLFSTTTPLVLAKKFALGSYVNFTNTYGMPIIHGKTNEADIESRERFADDIAESVNDRVIVTGVNDTIDVKTLSVSNSERIYIGLLDVINRDISNVVLGSESMAGATQSYVGSTQAHQDIFRDRISVYRKFIENAMNEQVIPRLIKMRYLKEGVKFRYNRRVDMSVKEKLETIKTIATYFEIPEEYIASEFGINVSKKETTFGGGGGGSSTSTTTGNRMSDEEYEKRYGRKRGENVDAKKNNVLLNSLSKKLESIKSK